MRRVLPAAVLAAALLLPAVAAAPGRADSSPDAKRALASFDVMERYLFDRTTGDYREQVGGRPGSHAWPFSQALAAQIAVTTLSGGARRTAVRRRFGVLERRFRKGSAYVAAPGGDFYLDDNEWLAQDFLDWYKISRDPAARARARAIFDAVVKAWDAAANHPCAGGVFWTTAAANRDRNTVSTANGALVGLRLYAVTREQRYLTWSRLMLGWLDRCMLSGSGLYGDHIALDGSVDSTQWSYNQGSVIGATVQLYLATGDSEALARAEEIGDAAVDYFADRWDAAEPPEFAAIFFRNLLVLAKASGRQDYVDVVERYARRAWLSARDARTGLFSFRGKTRLLDQAALVQLYAALARAGR